MNILRRTIPWLLTCFACWQLALAEEKPPTIAPIARCTHREANDQDDLCIWVHPTSPEESRVIASDKGANRIFVYDLAGKLKQSVAAKHPGNIDLRRGFPLGQEKIDIVAVNGRAEKRVYIYRVDATGQLARIDDGNIATADNYGGTLFRSPKTGHFFFISTGLSGRIEQFGLRDNGRGQISGERVREWKCRGICEGAVGDDELGRIFIADENFGVWSLSGEPGDAAPGELAIKRGQHGLTGDVEGLSLYRTDAMRGYLIVSNQGSNNFKVYRREPPHDFVGTFAIKGVNGTDGIELCQSPLGKSFPGGLFGCHSDEASPRPIVLSSWQSILAKLEGKPIP